MGEYGVNISYQFVVYIHRQQITAAEAVLIKNVLHCVSISTCNKCNYRNQKDKNIYLLIHN